MLFEDGFFSPKMRCGQGLYHVYFFPGCFVLLCFYVSFPSAVSMFCDYRRFFFLFFRALYIDKTFHCDRENNEADKRQQIFECQTSYIHKPVREKPRREENDVHTVWRVSSLTRTGQTSVFKTVFK